MNEKKKIMVGQNQDNRANKLFVGPWTKFNCINSSYPFSLFPLCLHEGLTS